MCSESPGRNSDSTCHGRYRCPRPARVRPRPGDHEGAGPLLFSDLLGTRSAWPGSRRYPLIRAAAPGGAAMTTAEAPPSSTPRRQDGGCSPLSCAARGSPPRCRADEASKPWARIGHRRRPDAALSSASRTWHCRPRNLAADGDVAMTAGQRTGAHARAWFGYHGRRSRRRSSVGRAAVSQTASRSARSGACRRRRRPVPGDGAAAMTAGQRADAHVSAGFGYHARSPRRCSSVGRAAVL